MYVKVFKRNGTSNCTQGQRLNCITLTTVAKQKNQDKCRSRLERTYREQGIGMMKKHQQISKEKREHFQRVAEVRKQVNLKTERQKTLKGSWVVTVGIVMLFAELCPCIQGLWVQNPSLPVSSKRCFLAKSILF